MTLSDKIMILAILLSPIIPILLGIWIGRRIEKRNKKYFIFSTLMSLRRAPLAADFVRCLNMIDIEFAGSSSKLKAVRSAWKEHRDHLNHYPGIEAGESLQKIWGDELDKLQSELLRRMGLALGYEFDITDIIRAAYIPQAHGDAENEWNTIRAHLSRIVSGNKPIPIRFLPIAGDEDNEKFATMLKEVVSGNRAIRIVIEPAQSELQSGNLISPTSEP